MQRKSWPHQHPQARIHVELNRRTAAATAHMILTRIIRHDRNHTNSAVTFT